jgi:phage terminase large subunit GpA-like protein
LHSLRTTLPGLASGLEVVFSALAAHATPEPELSASEYAEKYRVVGIESQSPHPGPWKNERAPYLVEVMDACQFCNGVKRVIITGCAQFGKSDGILNAVFQGMDVSPRGILVVLPSIDEARTWSRLKWEPNVAASPRIRGVAYVRKSRSSDGSTTMVKRFRGGSLEIATAGASKGLQMRTMGVCIFEECDQYEEEVGIGGDPIAAGEARMLTFGEDAKSILASTPGFAGRSRITSEYEASDQRRWMAPCPHCGDFQVLDFLTLSLHEGRPVFSCIGCGGVIEEAHKRLMNARAVWVPTFEHPESEPDARAANPAPPKLIVADEINRWRNRDCEGRARGYHLWQGQSNLSSWLTIWEKWQAVQAGSGDPKAWCRNGRRSWWARSTFSTIAWSGRSMPSAAEAWARGSRTASSRRTRWIGQRGRSTPTRW